MYNFSVQKLFVVIGNNCTYYNVRIVLPLCYDVQINNNDHATPKCVWIFYCFLFLFLSNHFIYLLPILLINLSTILWSLSQNWWVELFFSFLLNWCAIESCVIFSIAYSIHNWNQFKTSFVDFHWNQKSREFPYAIQIYTYHTCKQIAHKQIIIIIII